MDSSPQLSVELQQHGTFLRDLARSLVGDASLAEDLQQDAWVARMRSKRRGGAPTERVETRRWLSTVLRRGAANAHRGRGRRVARETAAARVEAVDSALDAAARMEMAETLLRMVRQIDEPARTAIIARYYEGLSFQEIGEREGCPPSTARSRVERGLEDLRRRLDAGPSGGREAWLSAVALLATPPKGAASAVAAGSATPLWIAAGVLVAAAGTTAAIRQLPSQAASPVLAEVSLQDPESALSPTSGQSTSATAKGLPREAVPAKSDSSRTAIEVATLDAASSFDGLVYELSETGERRPAAGTSVTWELDGRTPPALGWNEGGQTLAGMGYGTGTSGGVTATCNADGAYTWPKGKAPEPNEALIRIRVRGDERFAEISWEGSGSAWAAQEGPLELTRLPHGTFSGRVVDLRGRGIDRVNLVGTREGTKSTSVGVSDKDGSFSIPALGENASVIAEKTGWVMCSDEDISSLSTNGGTEPRVVMARAGKLQVYVGAGKVAPEFAIAVVSASESTRRENFCDLETFDSQADENGIVTLNGLPAGQRLVVRTGMDRAYTHMLGSDLVLEPESDRDPLPSGALPIVIPESGLLEVALADSNYRSIEGVALDEKGRPIPSSFVGLHAQWNGQLGGRQTVVTTRTDEQGRFQLRWLVTGELKPYLIIVEPQGGPTIYRALAPADMQAGGPLRIVATPPIRLNGKVLTGGGSPGKTRLFSTRVGMSDAGEELNLMQESIHVKADGSFQFEHHLGVPCRLFAKHPDFAPAMELVDGEPRKPLEITLTQAPKTPVKLKLDFGEANPKDMTDIAVISRPSRVLAGSPEADLWRTPHTVDAADGVAEISAAPGTYTVTILAVLKDGTRLSAPPLKELKVTDASQEIAVTLTPLLDIQSQVALKPGEHTGDLWITVHQPGEESPQRFGTTPTGRPSRFLQVDREGRFRFRGPAGSYDLQIGSRADLAQQRGRRVQTELRRH